jgi:hypothetical protein
MATTNTTASNIKAEILAAIEDCARRAEPEHEAAWDASEAGWKATARAAAEAGNDWFRARLAEYELANTNDAKIANNTVTNKNNAIPVKFDGYVVVAGDSCIGFGLSWEAAEKAAKSENRTSRLGLDPSDLDAQRVEVVVEVDADDDTMEATAYWSNGSEARPVMGYKLGEVLWRKKALDAAKLVKAGASKGWRVEVRQGAGVGQPDMVLCLTTSGRFVSVGSAASFDKVGAKDVATFGSYNAARATLTDARRRWPA